MADGRKRKKKAITLDQLKRVMTTAIAELETIYLNRGNKPDQRVRAINSLGSMANSYAKITEAFDLEKRIEKLEIKAMENEVQR